MHPGELAHLRAETNRWALPLAPPAVPLVDSSPLQLHQVEAGPPAWQVGACSRGRDTYVGRAKSETSRCSGNCRACRHPKVLLEHIKY